MRWSCPWLIAGLAGCSSPNDSDLFTEGPSNTEAATPSASTGAASGASATTETTGGNAATTSATGGGTGGSSADSTSDASATSTSSGGTTASTAANGGVGGSSGTASGSGGTGATQAQATSSSGGGAACTATSEVCDGQDNDCDEAVDEEQACPEDCSGAFFEGHAYVFCVMPLGEQGNRPARSWEWAMQYCMNRGQLLPRVETEEENSFLYDMMSAMPGAGDIWMSATNQLDEELWMWATGRDPDAWIPFYDADEDEPIDGAFNDWSGSPSGRNSACGVFAELGEGRWAWDTQNCESELERLICEDPDRVD